MSEKIIDREILAATIQDYQKKGRRIVFTNGCFDLLHIGHIRYLTAAKAQGDLLVVGLNTDRSVREIKGNARPITAENERAEVLAALSVVDFVTLFDEPDPFVTIEMLKPDVLVKGADWQKEAIVGADLVEAAGGQVVRIPLTEGAATTKVIEKILSLYREV